MSGQALPDRAAAPGSSLPPARSYGGEQHQGRGQALSFGYFWEIWCESNTIFFGNIIILGNIVIRISGKFCNALPDGTAGSVEAPLPSG